MPLLLLTFLLIFTFGAVAFAALFVLALRQWAKRRCAADAANATILFFSCVWFIVNLIITFKEMYQSPGVIWHWYIFLMGIACVFPPLIMRIFYLEEREYLPASRGWSIALAVVQVLSAALFLLAISFGIGIIWPFGTAPFARIRLFSLSLFGLFTVTSVFVIQVTRKTTRKVTNKRERQGIRWSIVMFALTISIFLLIIVSLFGGFPYGQFLGLASRSLPLFFISVGTYFRSRFDFFDAFVKQGAYFSLSLVVLTVFFAVIVPMVERANIGWGRPWVYAVFTLPIVFISPWAYRSIGAWLDRAWLGRRFTTVEAVKYFLSEIKEAVTEPGLVERAEACLNTIVQAPAKIILGPTETELDFERELTINIPSQGQPEGRIAVGKRLSEEPFFSEDIALLSSLADVFYSLLATIRLQIRKQEQEKREQELMISAGRSELKALRAQINPHFLFNALNAIAGLIQRDPDRAEETVERLAEVFRYTLRRSESEWVLLQDELEFIQAYLEIEQARFGERLQTALDIQGGAGEARIPAMLVQTLVENAIKHGVASVRGPGLVVVRARVADNRLQIEVCDNGPGFDLDAVQSRAETRSGGYGLKNVRQRLQGYFGEEGRLQVRRDPENNQLCVCISMPMATSNEQVSNDPNSTRG